MLNLFLQRALKTQKILWLVLILSYSVVFCQTAPSGEPVKEVSSGNFHVTSHKITFNEGRYLLHYLVPAFNYIINVDTSCISKDIIYIQLDDGNIIKLRITLVDIIPKEVKGPGFSGSGDYQKIDGDALYCLTTKGLYISTDDGSSWQLDTAGLGSSPINDLTLDPAQYVYAATDNGLYIQSPSSNQWNQINSTSFGFIKSFTKIFIDRKQRIYLAINSGGIMMSPDKGLTWAVDTAGLGSGFQYINAFGDDVFGNIYASTGGFSSIPNAIFKSIGGTSSWTRIDNGITAITLNTPAINAIGGDSVLYAGTSFGLYKSTDQGITWVEANDSIPAETFNGFAKSKNGRIIESTALAIYTQDASSNSWTKRFPVNGYEANLPLYQDGAGNLYTIEQGKYSPASIVKSTDNGTSWVYDTVGFSALSNPQLFTVDQNGSQYFTGTIRNGNISHAVVYQKQSGGSWTADTSGALSNVGFPSSIASDQHNWLYMSVYWSNPVGSQSQGVIRRPINGGVWAIDSAGLPMGFTNFYQMAPDRNGIMYGEDYFYLLGRTNSGWTSIPVPQQIPGTYYTAFSFDSSNTLYAALEEYSYTTNRSMGRGVYYTTNLGQSWTYAGLDSMAVHQLISYGNITYAITDRGIYIISGKGATSVEGEKQIPLRYELSQNYPNPFNPTTVISYQLAIGSLVTLKVYDVLGREVRTLVNKLQEAGKHSVNFNASELASGVYFYQLKAGGFISTKKMVVLK